MRAILVAISWRNPSSLSIVARSIVVQGRALVTAGLPLQTSHPAGLRPYHCPAFGTGELQEGSTTLRRRHSRARPDNGDAPLDAWARATAQPRLNSCRGLGRGLHDRTSRPHALRGK